MFSFESLINSSQQVVHYFNFNAQSPQESFKLASQLLTEAIRNRIQLQKTQPSPTILLPQQQIPSPKAHYNLAYVKHNRFLSPSQKRPVTPKVTQIIPVSPQKVFIFGKPKVKLDDGYGCPLHQENCEEFAENLLDQHLNAGKENQYPSDQAHFMPSSHTQELPYQYEEYLSPKNKLKKKNNKNSKQQIVSNKSIGTIRSPKNKNHKDVSNRLASQNSFGGNGSRINDSENLAKVESKIKELIQRDKRNRELEKQVEMQRQQIIEIEQRQKNLFMMQKYQQNIMSEETNIQHGLENEIWKITTTGSPQQLLIGGGNISEVSEIESSQDQFVVGYHGHQTRQQRSGCPDCEIQRLRMRKEKAKIAIKTIGKEERRRSNMIQSINRNEQFVRGLVGSKISAEGLPSNNSIRFS